MIATLEQLKAALGIPPEDVSQDAALTSALVQANGMIQAYIGYDVSDTALVREYTYGETNNPQNYGSWRNFVHLPEFPVIEVQEVLNSLNQPVAPSNYHLVKSHGRVEFLNGVSGNELLTFHYRAGYDPVPNDLVPVALNIAASIHNGGGTVEAGGSPLKSLTMFDAMSMSFDNSAMLNGPQSLLTAWAFVLDKYVIASRPVLK